MYIISVVPGMAPVDVAAFNTSSTSVMVMWSLPPPNFIFGILRGFEIRYHINDSNNTMSINNLTDADRFFEIHGLEEFKNYSIEVSAITIGNGPFSAPIYVVTDEDSKFHRMICN